MDIVPYLKLMIEKNASDLFLTVNSEVKIKIEGKIQSVGKTVLTSELIQAVAYKIMNKQRQSQFEKKLECDFAVSLSDKARFRVNVFQQRGEIGLVLRLVPNEIRTIETLGAPAILEELMMHKNGLILMTGSTGSGKSTTLAAMIRHRNERMSGHILTIEDPLEFNHSNFKSIVNQREVGVDTLSYENALKSSLREAPDVILIGEIRDAVTMETALQLSNTGCLTLSTLHANNANKAIERVINMFPQERHAQILMDLSSNIRAVLSQRLVMGVDRKRCAAIEIMVNTPYIADLIQKGRLEEIKQAMEDSGLIGMQTFDLALFNLHKDGLIELEEALNNADSRTNLEAKINFG